MKRIILILGLLLPMGVVQAEAVVDITQVAGKTESEVSTYLGDPTSCANSKHGNKCQYTKGEMEIVFIGGKADWITVEGIDGVPFSKAALGALGLSEAPPSFSNQFTMRWERIQGLREVALFKGGATSDYAYIKVKTE